MKRQLKSISFGLAAALGLALPGTILSGSRVEAQTQTTQQSRTNNRSRTTTRPRTTQPRTTTQPRNTTSTGTDPGTSTNTQSATDAQLRTDAQSRNEAKYRVTVRGLLTDMAEMDPQEVKLDLEDYRVVQANQALDATQLGSLTRLVEDNSTARRNQNLVTNMLRQSQRLSPAQMVVGADLRRRLLFVADNRVASPQLPPTYP